MKKLTAIFCAFAMLGICGTAFCDLEQDEGPYEKEDAASYSSTMGQDSFVLSDLKPKQPKKDILDQKFDGSEGTLKKAEPK